MLLPTSLSYRDTPVFNNEKFYRALPGTSHRQTDWFSIAAYVIQPDSDTEDILDTTLHDWNGGRRQSSTARGSPKRPNLRGSTHRPLRSGALNESTRPAVESYQRLDSHVKAKVIEAVDDFLIHLPFGTDANAAVLEEKVGRRLFQSELRGRQMQDKVLEWYASLDSMMLQRWVVSNFSLPVCVR